MGKSVEDAKKALTGFNLQGIVKGSGVQIVSQVPKAGEKVKNNSGVTLYTGAVDDEMKVKVPDVTGKSVEAANEIIVNSKLTIKVTGGESLDQKAVIYQQEPAAGALLSEGGTVVVHFKKEEPKQENQ